MKRIVTPLLASTALLALPAFASTDSAESDMQSFCENAFYGGDSDADNKLNLEEITRLRDAQYESLDANSDGSIDRDEFVNCIGLSHETTKKQAAELKTSEEEKAEAWSEMAADGPEVTAKDYADRAQAAWQKDPKKAQEIFTYNEWVENEEHYARAAINKFKSLDQDGDNVLTQEEYKTLPRDIQFDEQSLNARFDAMDADGSGTISPPEWRGAGVWAQDPGLRETGDDESDQSSSESMEDGTPVQIYYYYIEVL